MITLNLSGTADAKGNKTFLNSQNQNDIKARVKVAKSANLKVQQTLPKDTLASRKTFTSRHSSSIVKNTSSPQAPSITSTTSKPQIGASNDGIVTRIGASSSRSANHADSARYAAELCISFDYRDKRHPAYDGKTPGCQEFIEALSFEREAQKARVAGNQLAYFFKHKQCQIRAREAMSKIEPCFTESTNPNKDGMYSTLAVCAALLGEPERIEPLMANYLRKIPMPVRQLNEMFCTVECNFFSGPITACVAEEQWQTAKVLLLEMLKPGSRASVEYLNYRYRIPCGNIEEDRADYKVALNNIYLTLAHVERKMGNIAAGDSWEYKSKTLLAQENPSSRFALMAKSRQLLNMEGIHSPFVDSFPER